MLGAKVEYDYGDINRCLAMASRVTIKGAAVYHRFVAQPLGLHYSESGIMIPLLGENIIRKAPEFAYEAIRSHIQHPEGYYKIPLVTSWLRRGDERTFKDLEWAREKLLYDANRALQDYELTHGSRDQGFYHTTANTVTTLLYQSEGDESTKEQAITEYLKKQAEKIKNPRMPLAS